MTQSLPCNACGKRPVFSIGPPPISQRTLSHVPNQCDANSIVIAQAMGNDEEEEFVLRWNRIMRSS